MVKRIVLFATVVLASKLIFSPSVSWASVPLVEANIIRVNSSDACKIVRPNEPKGDLTVTVVNQGTSYTFTKAIYSDLCDFSHPVVITRLYYFYLDPNSAILGWVTEGAEGKPFSYVTFSHYFKP
jgi:hypothetical protein